MKSEWKKLLGKKENEIKRLQSELEIWKAKASLDHMTGVMNKCEGLRKLREDMENCSVLTVAFMDIDQLKAVNDRFGHCEGDKLLKEVTSILKKNIRKKDYIFRFGGDEFVIAFLNTTEEEAVEIWARIRKGISHYNANENLMFPMSLSTGFHEYRKEMHLTAETVIEFADKRMYQEKERNRKSIIK